jgi:hypothetical protein
VCNRSGTSEKRIRLGVEMLLDRVCVGGGYEHTVPDCFQVRQALLSRRTGCAMDMPRTRWTVGRPFIWCRPRWVTLRSRPPGVTYMPGRKKVQESIWDCEPAILRPGASPHTFVLAEDRGHPTAIPVDKLVERVTRWSRNPEPGSACRWHRPRGHRGGCQESKILYAVGDE